MPVKAGIFRYESGRLYADVSTSALPRAISLIKEYLLSRLYSDEERREEPLDFLDRTLDSMSRSMSMSANLDKILMVRRAGLKMHEEAAEQLKAIPETVPATRPYQASINITRGYRPANIAEIKVDKKGKGRACIDLFFGSSVGDDTKPLRWMQYDALMSRAQKAGFKVDRGTMDADIKKFAESEASYFRKCIQEAMSAFEYSELEAAINFLWPSGWPDDVKKKLGK